MAKSGKSASISKCLECGCGMVGQDHGLNTVQIAGNNGGISTTSNVSTATIVDYTAGKSAEGEDAPAEETPAEDAPVAEATETPAEDESASSILDEKTTASILQKAVQSATESVKAEIAALEDAFKAAQDRVIALESELVTAKSAAANGGPKRTGVKAVTKENELLVKAMEYRAKAAATSDPYLAKGYKALAEQFTEKATAASGSAVVVADDED